MKNIKRAKKVKALSMIPAMFLLVIILASCINVDAQSFLAVQYDLSRGTFIFHGVYEGRINVNFCYDLRILPNRNLTGWTAEERQARGVPEDWDHELGRIWEIARANVTITVTNGEVASVVVCDDGILIESTDRRIVDDPHVKNGRRLIPEAQHRRVSGYANYVNRAEFDRWLEYFEERFMLVFAPFPERSLFWSGGLSWLGQRFLGYRTYYVRGREYDAELVPFRDFPDVRGELEELIFPWQTISYVVNNVVGVTSRRGRANMIEIFDERVAAHEVETRIWAPDNSWVGQMTERSSFTGPVEWRS